MLIDWFTVGAQALNFLILVWLMKRFLYRPILGAIDARESRIAAELADADAKKAEAQREHDEFRLKNEEFDREQAGMLSRAREEAMNERQRLLEESRAAIEAVRVKRHETLRNEARNLNQTVRRRAQHEVFAIARKVLADLASASLEERMCAVFTRRLGAMDGDLKAALADALKSSSETVIVRSAFELSVEQHDAIRGALQETFRVEVPLRFETVPDLVGGIEFTVDGHKVAWSIADYLVSLEHSVDELLSEAFQSHATAVSGATEKPLVTAKAAPAPQDQSTPGSL